jgi:hypothetical protein
MAASGASHSRAVALESCCPYDEAHCAVLPGWPHARRPTADENIRRGPAQPLGHSPVYMWRLALRRLGRPYAKRRPALGRSIESEPVLSLRCSCPVHVHEETHCVSCTCVSGAQCTTDDRVKATHSTNRAFSCAIEY